MGALTATTVRRRVRDLAAWVRSASVAGPELLEGVTRELAPVLGTEQTVAYGIDAGADRLRLDFLASPFPGARGLRRDVDALLERQPTAFGHYDPRCPPVPQRNAVVTLAELRSITGSARTPMLSLLARHGFATENQLRALLCDGPVLLAWVGALRDRPFGAADRRALRALVRPLRDRLALERRLEAVPWARAALEAALDRLATAAVVVRRPLRLLHCNGQAQALLAGDRAGFLAELREALEERGPASWFLTPLGTEERTWLALRRRPPRDPAGPAAAAARAFALTPRQAQVLEQVARGEANKSIAALLGCSESAVEQHVTALLHRYGVESRAQLVARFWSEAG